MEIPSVVKITEHDYNTERVKVIKTLVNPVTKQEFVVCEIYTFRGKIDRYPGKGESIDIIV